MKNLALLPFSFSQKFTYCLQTDHKTPLERLSDSAEIFQKIFYYVLVLNHFKLEKKNGFKAESVLVCEPRESISGNSNIMTRERNLISFTC